MCFVKATNLMSTCERINKFGETLVEDRVFWIYFIIALFFIIIGIGIITTSDDPQVIIICILWVISIILLLMITYNLSINLGPTDTCVVDSNSRCFEPNNRVWLFVNIIFVILLVLSLLWAGELKNSEGSPLKTTSGILIILGGILLCYLSTDRNLLNIHITFASVAFVIIWLILSLYVIVE